MLGLLSGKKPLTQRVTSRDVCLPKEKQIQELFKEIASHAKANNFQWLSGKLQCRPTTTCLIVAYKAVWISHKASKAEGLHPLVPATLHPTLLQIIETWDSSKKQPNRPGVTSISEDEAEFCHVVVDYAKFVDHRIGSLELFRTAKGSVDGFEGLQSGTSSLYTVERFIYLLSLMVLAFTRLIERRVSVFFPLHVGGIVECLEDGPQLLSLVLRSLEPILHTIGSDQGGRSDPLPNIESTIFGFLGHFTDLLEKCHLLASRYSELNDVQKHRVAFGTVSKEVQKMFGRGTKPISGFFSTVAVPSSLGQLNDSPLNEMQVPAPLEEKAQERRHPDGGAAMEHTERLSDQRGIQSSLRIPPFDERGQPQGPHRANSDPNLKQAQTAPQSPPQGSAVTRLPSDASSERRQLPPQSTAHRLISTPQSSTPSPRQREGNSASQWPSPSPCQGADASHLTPFNESRSSGPPIPRAADADYKPLSDRITLTNAVNNIQRAPAARTAFIEIPHRLSTSPPVAASSNSRRPLRQHSPAPRLAYPAAMPSAMPVVQRSNEPPAGVNQQATGESNVQRDISGNLHEVPHRLPSWAIGCTTHSSLSTPTFLKRADDPPSLPLPTYLATPHGPASLSQQLPGCGYSPAPRGRYPTESPAPGRQSSRSLCRDTTPESRSRGRSSASRSASAPRTRLGRSVSAGPRPGSAHVKSNAPFCHPLGLHPAEMPASLQRCRGEEWSGPNRGWHKDPTPFVDLPQRDFFKIRSVHGTVPQDPWQMSTIGGASVQRGDMFCGIPKLLKDFAQGVGLGGGENERPVPRKVAYGAKLRDPFWEPSDLKGQIVDSVDRRSWVTIDMAHYGTPSTHSGWTTAGEAQGGRAFSPPKIRPTRHSNRQREAEAAPARRLSRKASTAANERGGRAKAAAGSQRRRTHSRQPAMKVKTPRKCLKAVPVSGSDLHPNAVGKIRIINTDQWGGKITHVGPLQPPTRLLQQAQVHASTYPIADTAHAPPARLGHTGYVADEWLPPGSKPSRLYGVPHVQDSPIVKASSMQHVPSHQGRTQPQLFIGATVPTELQIDMSEIQIIKPIGKGATSEVFLGMWRGGEVAVKKLKMDPESIGGPNAAKKKSNLKEFFRELGIMLRLRHPNLVLFMGTRTNAAPFCLVTEYCAGGTLFELLHGRVSDGPSRRPKFLLSWNQQLKLCLDVARGCLSLHSSNPPIIHRDIKSLNILLAKQISGPDDVPLAKISDFGLSRIKQDPLDWGYLTGMAGTYHWMAPEVLLNRAYTEKADVYSYSIVMFEILTQTVPYVDSSGGSPMAVAFNVAKGKRPDLQKLPPGCPQEILDLMVACWSDLPEQRPSFRHIVAVLGDNAPPGFI